MNYILLMTSAGSILFVGQLLLEMAMGKRMSQACRYRMLVVVLFAYLVPLAGLKDLYGDMALPLPVGKARVSAESGALILGDAVIHAKGGFFLTSDYSAKLFATTVWVGIAALVMLVRCAAYFYNRNAFLRCARGCDAGVPEELVLRLKQELHVSRRVRVVRIPSEKRSFTLGAIRPVVFLQKDCKEDELAYILRHEFTHIARGDLLAKLLMELVCCLHWFNPLVYWLNHRLDRTCEKACDERVVRDMSGHEREAYARLVIRSMQGSGKKPKKKVLFVSFFASGEKFARERIKVIMDKRKRKFWEKIVVAGAFAALLFVDSLTAMAYPHVYDVTASAEVAESSVRGTALLNLDGGKSEIPTLYDEQVVTADGVVRPVREQPQWICIFHKWQDAEYQTHEKDGSGGCVVNVYECSYCAKCESIKVGDLKYTATYNPCPHDYDD